MKPKQTIKQLILYLVVGGAATVVEWAFFYLFCNILGINYVLSTALAFAISTFANWIFGKWIIFKEWSNVWTELLKVYLTSIAGLLFNIAIMWIAVDKLQFSEMIGKMIATGLVFIWNFLVRKLLIYRV